MFSIKECAGRLKRKLTLEKLPADDIAAGWALGVFIGCAIPFGLQLVIAVPLAIMMKVSKIGATAGTFISNPITVFILYPLQTLIVNRLVFGGSITFERLKELFTGLTFSSLMSLGADIIISFFLGGIVLAVICTPITYFLVKDFVITARKFKERKALKNG